MPSQRSAHKIRNTKDAGSRRLQNAPSGICGSIPGLTRNDGICIRNPLLFFVALHSGGSPPGRRLHAVFALLESKARLKRLKLNSEEAESEPEAAPYWGH